jgi:elongation factor 1-gamma
LGSDPETRALIQQWICFTDGELLPNVAHFMICIFGMIPYEQAAWDQKLAALDRALKRMEVGLKGKKFLVGEQLTLADISAASALHFAFKTVIDAKWRESLPAVVDWFNNVLASEGPKDWPAAEFVDVAKRPGQ